MSKFHVSIFYSFREIRRQRAWRSRYHPFYLWCRATWVGSHSLRFTRNNGVFESLFSTSLLNLILFIFGQFQQFFHQNFRLKCKFWILMVSLERSSSDLSEYNLFKIQSIFKWKMKKCKFFFAVFFLNTSNVQ